MIHDDQAAATKQDIHMLMNEIGKLYDANERWKNEILEKNEGWKEEIILHFDATAENIRHDLTSANREEIDVLQTKVARLERHAGLAA